MPPEHTRFRSISTLLIQRIIWLSIGCLLVLGGLHAWVEFRHEQQNFERSMRMLADNSMRNLSMALWDIDPKAVREQVNWMGALPEVAHVQVKVQATGERFMNGQDVKNVPATVSVQIMPPDGQAIPLGVLEIWADPQYFLSIMAQSTLRVTFGYALFTLLICAMVAWVMRRELRQPLSQIARFAAGLKPNELATPLRLHRPHREQSDEIDLVIQGFQQLQGDLRSYIDNLDQLVADRTQKLEVLVDEVKRLSLMDALTGCFNRRALDERLPSELERSLRYDRPMSLVFVDIDHFKAINDQHGHGVGDIVLREVASRLQSHLRSQVDWVARYGGEEFLVVMPETTVQEALESSQRLADVVRTKPVLAQGMALQVTASFGIAQLREGETLHSLLERADSMLYQAKADGRNCARMAI
ncbi:MAG: diguanylate cyclase [Comamonas sp.]